MSTRKLETYKVSTVTRIGDLLALVSTAGVVFSYAAAAFAREPQPGDNLQLESLDGVRISGLYDNDNELWLFQFTDQQLAEQDRAYHATQTQPDKGE